MGHVSIQRVSTAVAAVCLIAGTSVAQANDATEFRDRLAEELSAIQANFRLADPDGFGGVWIDEDGDPVIAVVSGDSGAFARATTSTLSRSVRVTTVARSEQAIRGIHLGIRSLARAHSFSIDGVLLASIYDDLTINSVVVEAVGATDAELARLEAKFGSGVIARSVSQAPFPSACTHSNCPNPLKAGLYLYHNGGSDCVSSFVFRAPTTPATYFLSTSGHCSSPNESKQHPSGASIGSVAIQSAGGSVDAAMIRIAPSQASNKMYGNTGIWTITSREAIMNAVLGEYVCSSRPSGQTCGNLTSKNVDLAWVDDQFSATGQYGRGGDSGSPVYYGSKAIGVMSGASCEGCSTSYYTPIQNVEIWSRYSVQITTP